MFVSCGKCVGCRKRRAAEWATRAVHEAARSEHNCFVTLTYDEASLPEGGDLRPRDLQLFLKRVRNAVRRKRSRLAGILGERMRFLACGEYGGVGGRPHYHALLFGVGFSDGYPVKKALFESESLSDLWSRDGKRLGNASYGSVTGASAAYVAQYSMKKRRGDAPVEWYGEGIVKHPPFLRCSLKPGIGGYWLDEYRNDARHGFLVRDGNRIAVPRYYQKRLEVTDIGLAEESREYAADYAESVRRTQMELDAGEAIELRRHELMDARKFNF